MNLSPSLINRCKFAVGLASAAFALTSQAAVVNGGFESGTLSGWSSIGVSAVIGAGGGGPVEGTYQAYIDTSPSDETQGPHTSTLSQTFVGQGVVSFAWNFFTNEELGGAFNDVAFVVLDGIETQLADVFSAFSASSLGGYADMTGYQILSLDLGYVGTHTLTFGVRDAIDGGVDSALLVDRVAVVPEPGALSLSAAALLAAALVRRRRRPNGLCAG